MSAPSLASQQNTVPGGHQTNQERGQEDQSGVSSEYRIVTLVKWVDKKLHGEGMRESAYDFCSRNTPFCKTIGVCTGSYVVNYFSGGSYWVTGLGTILGAYCVSEKTSDSDDLKVIEAGHKVALLREKQAVHQSHVILNGLRNYKEFPVNPVNKDEEEKLRCILEGLLHKGISKIETDEAKKREASNQALRAGITDKRSAGIFLNLQESSQAHEHADMYKEVDTAYKLNVEKRKKDLFKQIERTGFRAYCDEVKKAADELSERLHDNDWSEFHASSDFHSLREESDSVHRQRSPNQSSRHRRTSHGSEDSPDTNMLSRSHTAGGSNTGEWHKRR